MLTDVAATHETVLRLISLKAKQEAVANEEEEEGVKHYIYSTDFLQKHRKLTTQNWQGQLKTRAALFDFSAFFMSFFYIHVHKIIHRHKCIHF